MQRRVWLSLFEFTYWGEAYECLVSISKMVGISLTFLLAVRRPVIFFFSPLTAFPSIRHAPLVMGLFEQMGSSETEGWRAQDDSPLTCCLTYEIDLAPINSTCTQQYSNLCWKIIQTSSVLFLYFGNIHRYTICYDHSCSILFISIVYQTF